MSARPEVVGRDEELQALQVFVGAHDVEPRGLLLIGDIGIGKTTLWSEGAAAAAAHGYQVLSCRPVEAEIALPFAALGDLLEAVPDDVLATLPDPQRDAVQVALLREEARAGPPLGHAVALGVLGTFRALAKESPIVVAIDDVQWLDPPSGEALAFAARRLREEPVRFLLARRDGAIERADGGIESSLAGSGLTRLRVGPLTLQALDRLLLERLEKQFLRPALAQLHRVSGGNPFFALELGRALAERELPLAPGEPVPVPATLHELVRDRLAALPSAAREVALAVASLSRPTVELVVAATGSEDATAALENAAAAGVVEFAGERIRFTHPLLASVIYAGAPPSQRHAVHARLAEVVEDQDERARHLALAASGPDRDVAAAVEFAARRARSRGAPQAAAELWERARRLTPPEDADGWRRAVEAAECHLEAGDTDRARVLLEDVVAELPPGRDRAFALTRLAWVRAFGEGFHAGADLFRAALRELGDDPAVEIEIERGLAWSIHEIGDVAAAEQHARAALELAERLGDPALLASALADAAFFETIRGRGVPSALIERALELDTGEEWRSILGRVRPEWVHGMLLEWAGELDAARATLLELRERALAHGDDHSLAYVAFHLGRVEVLAGNWELAGRYADECFDMTAQTGQADERPFALTLRALIDAHLGRVAEARAGTDEGMPLALDVGVIGAHFELLAIRGFLEHSLGSPTEAHRFLGGLPRAVAEAGFGEPALFRFHGDTIETLLALGDQKQAGAVLAELEEQAATTQGIWAQTIASRCRALVDATAGDIGGALARAERTLELHERLQEPFERSRTLLVLGTLQRRARKKRDARASLTQALAVFDALGASLWSEKARAELGRIGGRVAAAPGALTPTEERVAALVASGQTYREVADALFISPKTVQWNLSKIYRKLGCRSRAELAALLASQGRSQPLESAPSEQTPAVPPVTG